MFVYWNVNCLYVYILFTSLVCFVYFLRSLFVDILFFYLNRNIKITYIFSNSCLYICLLAYCLVCMLFTCLKENQINLHLACSSCLWLFTCLFEWYLSNLFAPAVNPFLLTGLFTLLINCLPKPGCSKTPWFLVYCCCLPLFAFYCLSKLIIPVCLLELLSAFVYVLVCTMSWLAQLTSTLVCNCLLV